VGDSDEGGRRQASCPVSHAFTIICTRFSMVLNVVQALASRIIPYNYAWHILAGLVVFTALRIFSQGRTTNRERDLHDRTFLVTVGCMFFKAGVLSLGAAGGIHSSRADITATTCPERRQSHRPHRRSYRFSHNYHPCHSAPHILLQSEYLR